MAPRRKLPDPTTLRLLRQQGWTLGDIAEKYDVGETAVWKALERAGLVEERMDYRALLPWRILPKHQTSATMDRFRYIVRQKNGEPLSDVHARRLEKWLQGLAENNVVVDYHEDAPPNAASKVGGFYYTPRKPEDKWIIREPAE